MQRSPSAAQPTHAMMLKAPKPISRTTHARDMPKACHAVSPNVCDTLPD